MKPTKLVRVFTDTGDFYDEVRNALSRNLGRQVTVAEAAEYIAKRAFGDTYDKFMETHTLIIEEASKIVEDPEYVTSTTLPVAS